MFFRSRFFTFFLLFLNLAFLLNLARGLRNFQRRTEIIKGVNLKLQAIKEENDNLKRQLARVESWEYIEEEARKKLNLAREGEIVLILPPISLSPSPSPLPQKNLSNLQQWFQIFF